MTPVFLTEPEALSAAYQVGLLPSSEPDRPPCAVMNRENVNDFVRRGHARKRFLTSS